MLFRPSVGIITDFRLLPEPSLPPASSLIFLARVGRTLLRRVSRKSDDTSNTRSRRSWRELTRLPIPSLSLFSSDFDRARKIRYFLGRRKGGRGIERRESRDRPGLNRKIPGIRLFGRDFSVDTGRALDSVASTDYARNCIQILFLIPSTRPPFLSITFNRAPTIAL